MMNKRGAYFFVIDAFLAATVIVGALIIIFTSRQSSTEAGPAISMVENFLRMVETTPIRNLQSNLTRQLVLDGNITDLDNTILEQITEFYYLNASGKKDTKNQTAALLKDAAGGLISEHRSIMVYMYTNSSEKNLVFNKSLFSQERAGLLLTGKRINFKMINDSFIYGPVVFEVKLWV